MGLSLKTAANRFTGDRFLMWNAATNAFDGTLIGKRFRLDRFTTIYHRPTRRAYIRFKTDETPASGVVMRDGTSEVYLVSETLHKDIELGSLVYERMRMSHLATAPSGGLGGFIAVRTTGSGDDLGVVSLALSEPAYVDFELQSATSVEENIDAVTPRFLINHSNNIEPLHGDVFEFSGRTFIVSVPYVDGGLRVCRASELPPAYETFTYHLRSGTGSYNPVTGTVTSPTVTRLFSGILGKKTSEAEKSTVPQRLELYVYEHHVGFAFQLGHRIDHQSTAYYVNSVTRLREEKQWKLELSK